MIKKYNLTANEEIIMEINNLLEYDYDNISPEDVGKLCYLITRYKIKK